MSLTGFNLMRRKRAAAKAAQESPAVDYDSMKIEDLKAAAKDAGIEGAASMKKADLLAALQAQSDDPKEGETGETGETGENDDPNKGGSDETNQD